MSGPDWPPRRSAIYLPDGSRGRGSTGQLFEVKKGQWVRIWDEIAEAGMLCAPWRRYPSVLKMTPEWVMAIHLCDPGSTIDEILVPSRPIGFQSFRQRFRAAWLVFRGQADALVWPKGQ